MKKVPLLIFVSGCVESTGLNHKLALKKHISNILPSVVVTPCKGGYNGVDEESLMVECQTIDQVNTIKKLAFNAPISQDAVTIRHGDNSVTIEYSNDKLSNLSPLTQVNKNEAMFHGFYTLVNNQYWISKA